MQELLLIVRDVCLLKGKVHGSNLQLIYSLHFRKFGSHQQVYWL